MSRNSLGVLLVILSLLSNTALLKNIDLGRETHYNEAAHALHSVADARRPTTKGVRSNSNEQHRQQYLERAVCFIHVSLDGPNLLAHCCCCCGWLAGWPLVCTISTDCPTHAPTPPTHLITLFHHSHSFVISLSPISCSSARHPFPPPYVPFLPFRRIYVLRSSD